MKRAPLSDMTIAQLVSIFESIALAQDEALAKYRPISVYNRLFDQMREVAAELKSRQGDQRRALVPLMNSRNLQVKLKTAITVLPVAYGPARAMLEHIKALQVYPEAANAAEILKDLDNGSHNPK